MRRNYFTFFPTALRAVQYGLYTLNLLPTSMWSSNSGCFTPKQHQKRSQKVWNQIFSWGDMSPKCHTPLARALRSLYAISHVHTGTPLFKILDPPLICVRNPMHRHFGVSRPIFQDPPGTKIFAWPKLLWETISYSDKPASYKFWKGSSSSCWHEWHSWVPKAGMSSLKYMDLWYSRSLQEGLTL